MLTPPGNTRSNAPVEERPIGEIVHRLLDEGKAYARAEAKLAKAQAGLKAKQWKGPAILFAIAGTFALSAVITLCLTVAASLATLVGPLAGGLLATLAALLVAGILGSFAAKKLKDR